MDPVHERGSMDPVHILMDPAHGPGPRRRSMDQGSMFCTFPVLGIDRAIKIFYLLISLSGPFSWSGKIQSREKLKCYSVKIDQIKRLLDYIIAADKKV